MATCTPTKYLSNLLFRILSPIPMWMTATENPLGKS